MVRRFTTLLAAGALAVGPIAAQAAAPLSPAAQSDTRASAALEDASALRGNAAPIALGILLLILFVAVLVSGESDPVSP